MKALDHASSSSSSSISAPVPRIAIIGAGAAGLAATRAFSSSRSHQRYEITILEKEDRVAGVWNYQPNRPDRPMYRGLRTNLPKEIMQFREFPFRLKTSSSSSFVTHQQVAEYLYQYSKEFDLDQYIMYNCVVQQLTCLSTSSRLSTWNTKETWPQIRLEWKTQQGPADEENQTSSAIFDAVLVCNGHYSRPQIPPLPGLMQYFRGRTMHSVGYDDPMEFQNQRVLCIGGRASGSDLAREIATFAPNTTVFLSDSAFAHPQPVTQHKVTWLPKTQCILPDGRVQFDSCGMKEAEVEPIQVDTIIFCSGYDYDFPFINEHSNLELEAFGRRVKPLYEQLWHAYTPNVAFVGLPHSIVPFPLFELQSAAVENSWRHPLDLPSLEQRIQLAQKDAESGGEGKTNGRVPEDTHYLGSRQWDYCLRMAKYAGILDNELEDYIATSKVSMLFLALASYCWNLLTFKCFPDRKFMIIQGSKERVAFLQARIFTVLFAMSEMIKIVPFDHGCWASKSQQIL